MHRPLSLALWLLVLPGSACSSAATAAPPDTARTAIGAAPRAPQILLPGVVSTGDDDCHATLSPDGKTLFFLKDAPSFDLYTIVYTERRNGAWTRPRTVPFSGQYPDGDLAFTADGRRAYFVSSRPVGGVPRSDTEIWTVARDASGRWGEPRHVDELSSPTDEWFPTLTADGTMYFGSGRRGGLGGSDIWRARWLGDHFAAPENLGVPVNSPGDEIEAFVTPDESALVFAAKGRPDSLGSYDLYVSRRTGGAWQAPSHPGPPVNSPAWDFGARLSPDGQLLLFSSNRGFGSEPLDRPLTFDELEQRIRAPHNGLRDVYVVDPKAIGL
jgi:Tol biopolymer transport system component